MEKLFKSIFAYNLLNSNDKFEFFKGFGKDLQTQFPNGEWKTINGAKVFIHGGKVVAGLDNFNGKIDDFFKEKEKKDKFEVNPEIKEKLEKVKKEISKKYGSYIEQIELLKKEQRVLYDKSQIVLGDDFYDVSPDERIERNKKYNEFCSLQVESINKELDIRKKARNVVFDEIKHKNKYKEIKFVPAKSSFIKKRTEDLNKNLKESSDFIRNLIGDGFKNETDFELSNKSNVFLSIYAAGYRAQCDYNSIFIGLTAETSTIIHEMGHYIEHTNKEVKQSAINFLKKRIKDSIPVPIYENRGETEIFEEVGVKDGFLNHYMGKIYKNNKGDIDATEIISMGLQYLYQDPVKLLKEDEEYFDFMYSILHDKKYRNESNS